MRKSTVILVILVSMLGSLVAVIWLKKAVYFDLKKYPDGESAEWRIEESKRSVWQGVEWQLPSKSLALEPCPPDILLHSKLLRTYYCSYEGRYVNAFGKSIRSEKWGLGSEHRFLLVDYNDQVIAIEYKLKPNKEKALQRFSTLPDSSESSILSFLSKIHQYPNASLDRPPSVPPDS